MVMYESGELEMEVEDLINRASLKLFRLFSTLWLANGRAIGLMHINTT